MSWILLTNDDGIDSPALAPFAAALTELGTVRVVVPDRERSWVGKAITRIGPIRTDKVELNGRAAWTCTGYPADAVQRVAQIREKLVDEVHRVGESRRAFLACDGFDRQRHPAQSNECAYHCNAHLNGLLGLQNAGRHDGPVLGEHIGHVLPVLSSL